MAVVINEVEVTPAPPPAAAPPASQGGSGGDSAQPEAIQKIERAMRVAHERKHRLAAY
jgi:hypothetical protein